MTGGSTGRAARAAAGLTLLLVVAMAGCSQPVAGPDDGDTSATPAGPTSSEPSGDGTRPTLADLFDDPTGDVLLRTVGRETDHGDYLKSEVVFASEGERVSGTLTRPVGKGPFPAVVSIHGYLPAGEYEIGQGLVREEIALARRGFVVLHPDLRGYGDSAPLTSLERGLRLAYTDDALHAISAVRSLPSVDPARVGLLGRSMGGGIALNVLVTHPHAVSAAVLLSPISSDFARSLDVLDSRVSLARELGTPEDDPRAYRELSADSYFDRVRAPVLILHGTADTVVPLAESERTLRLLLDHGVDAALTPYPREGHLFTHHWRAEVRQLGDFFQARLTVGR